VFGISLCHKASVFSTFDGESFRELCTSVDLQSTPAACQPTFLPRARTVWFATGFVGDVMTLSGLHQLLYGEGMFVPSKLRRGLRTRSTSLTRQSRSTSVTLQSSYSTVKASSCFHRLLYNRVAFISYLAIEVQLLYNRGEGESHAGGQADVRGLLRDHRGSDRRRQNGTPSLF
jgi:hypothetical protein